MELQVWCLQAWGYHCVEYPDVCVENDVDVATLNEAWTCRYRHSWYTTPCSGNNVSDGLVRCVRGNVNLCHVGSVFGQSSPDLVHLLAWCLHHTEPVETMMSGVSTSIRGNHGGRKHVWDSVPARPSQLAFLRSKAMPRSALLKYLTSYMCWSHFSQGNHACAEAATTPSHLVMHSTR